MRCASACAVSVTCEYKLSVAVIVE
jgi:hypothetical protein